MTSMTTPSDLLRVRECNRDLKTEQKWSNTGSKKVKMVKRAKQKKSLARSRMSERDANEEIQRGQNKIAALAVLAINQTLKDAAHCNGPMTQLTPTDQGARFNESGSNAKTSCFFVDPNP